MDRGAAGSGGPLDYFKALRPHQWVKNALVFVPAMAAHETQIQLWLAAGGVFVALSACASGAYLFNDWLDLPHDRRHASKRHRPVAAGRVALRPLLAIGAALPAGGLALAFWLSIPTGLCVLLYLLVSLAYSLWLKRQVFIDVVVLGLLYGVRVFAGAVAVSVPLSPWFSAFFLFAFFALAIVKRQSELCALQQANQTAADGRAYLAGDLAAMTALGAASGFTSVVVLALYIQSQQVSALYARPEWLWLICPLLIYWLGRITLIANRGAVDDDPVVFALRDRASWVTGLGILAAFFLAAL